MRRVPSFPARLAIVAAAGLAIRLVYALAFAPDPQALSDARFFHLLANGIADGRGFAQPYDFLFKGVVHPTAEHPPLYPLALAAMSKLGGTTYDAHRVVSCLLGTGTVVAVGFLARRVAGDAIGILAAAIAAVYPLLWLADGSLMSESLYGLVVVLSLLCALRVLERPTAWRAVLLGAAAALATLTRGEALLLVPLLLLPVAWMAGGRDGLAGRARLAGVCVAAFAVVLVPWTVRNWTAFDQPVLVSNNTGTLLAGANCRYTYSGELLGSWWVRCVHYPPQRNEAKLGSYLRRRGLDYARGRTRRFLYVGVIRVLRTWELFRPGQQIRFASEEGRRPGAERAGVAMYYLMLPFAIAGVVLLRRRRDLLLVLLAPAAMVTIMSFLGYGTTRFRLAAEPSIVVLASTGLAALAARVRARAAERTAAAAG
jgi:4-amino-4-deoxy-L-arabinose transferase-like glycosyltransferase